MRERTRCLVKGIFSDVGNPSMESGNLMASFLAVLRSLFASRQMALVAFQSLEVGSESFRILDRRTTVRADSKRRNTKIDTNGLPCGRNNVRNLFFYQHADIPSASSFADGCRKHTCVTGRNVAVFFQTDCTKPRKLDTIFKNTDGL